jgi:hypothetical protein
MGNESSDHWKDGKHDIGTCVVCFYFITLCSPELEECRKQVQSPS